MYTYVFFYEYCSFSTYMYVFYPFWVKSYIWSEIGDNFILLHMDVQLSQDHLVETIFPLLNGLGPLVKKSFDQKLKMAAE